MMIRPIPFFVLALSSTVTACSGEASSVPSEPTSSAPAGSGSASGSRPGTETATSPTDPGAPSTPASACDAAGREICARACGCADDGKCRVGVDIDAGTPATMNFADEAHCLDFFLLRCSTPRATAAEYETCRSEVKAAACVAPPGGKAVLVPPACRTKE